MNGKLNDQPLAELIREIASKGFSGTLRLEHERVKTAVYFEVGEIVFAASNVRALRLREYLKKKALVPEKELGTFEDNRSDLSFARALSSKGTLREEDVMALLATVVADTLRVALLWQEGTWEFNERARLDDPAHVTVDTPNLLREAAQRMDGNIIATRFRNPNEMITRAADVGTIDNCLPAESFILSRLDAPIKLEELVSVSGLPEAEANRILYGLALSGLVTREYWQNAFRTQQAPPKKAEPAKTKKQRAQSKAAAPVPPAETQKSGDNWSSAKEEPTVEEADLEVFLERLSKAVTYYEVLGLPTSAHVNEIKSGYYALARRYHPDRFHLKSGTNLHEQISSAFARITQAYETLMNPKSRGAYDKALERALVTPSGGAGKPKPAPTAKPPVETPVQTESSDPRVAQAETIFKEGFSALEAGKTGAAISQLGVACRLAPKEAKYRAYYGKALAANEKARRLAETEFQAAIKLEPNNATYRTMLAQLYFDLKFHKRAQSELERALAVDPNNKAARTLMLKLDPSRKAG
ncbi:MAG: DUF4388 domain-containing protein [Pyrinomonadaceae bacterium]